MDKFEIFEELLKKKVSEAMSIGHHSVLLLVKETNKIYKEQQKITIKGACRMDIEDNKKLEELVEELAELEHDRWSRWMKHLFDKSDKTISSVLTALDPGSVVIPKQSVERWVRQMGTEYKDLSEEEKESDRKEARKTIELLKKTKTV